MSRPVYVLDAAKVIACAAKLGLIQGEIAVILRVEPSTVSRWFSGGHQPRGGKLDELAVLLEVESWRDISKVSRPQPAKPEPDSQPGDDW